MSEKICDGVKMLIERMQTNPEDFEYGSNMSGYSNTMEDILRNPKDHQPLWFLSDVEKKALVDAYKEMHKTKFTAGVVQAILAPDPQYDINMDRPYKIPSTLLAPRNLMNQAREILNEQFETEYAKSSRTRP